VQKGWRCQPFLFDTKKTARQGGPKLREVEEISSVRGSTRYLPAGEQRTWSSTRMQCDPPIENLAMVFPSSIATWIGVSQMIRGESLVRGGEVAAGLKEIAAGMDAHRGMEATTYQPFGLSLLANGLVAAGRLDEALEAVDDALAISERSGERFYLAELVRLKGEVLARKGSPSEAERWLREAIRVSRQQGARLFELRSAVSLCGVLDEAGRETALHDVVEPIYGWFEAGGDAPDLRAARALLTAGTRAN